MFCFSLTMLSSLFATFTSNINTAIFIRSTFPSHFCKSSLKAFLSPPLAPVTLKSNSHSHNELGLIFIRSLILHWNPSCYWSHTLTPFCALATLHYQNRSRDRGTLYWKEKEPGCFRILLIRLTAIQLFKSSKLIWLVRWNASFLNWSGELLIWAADLNQSFNEDNNDLRQLSFLLFQVLYFLPSPSLTLVEKTC